MGAVDVVQAHRGPFDSGLAALTRRDDRIHRDGIQHLELRVPERGEIRGLRLGRMNAQWIDRGAEQHASGPAGASCTEVRDRNGGLDLDHDH
jgi:hypothetical protein